jgi:tetratricopeptide (TPR) repeat protein
VDGLGAVFFFGSLIAFLKWRESAAARWLIASVFLFTGAMFTKETMVFVPILIAVYLWLTSSGAGRVSRILKILLPYGVVWIVYMAIRHEVIKPVGAGAEYIHPTFTLVNVWTAPYAIWWYIGHLLMPWGLCVEYATRILEHPTLRGFVLPAAGLVVLLAAAVWLWSVRRSKRAAFLMFWFVLTLSPAVIVAPMVLQHDRYLYISSYAFCALIAWAVLYLGNLPAATRLAVAVCIVALWSGMTWHEMGYWDCETTLWGRAHQIAPSELRAQMALASIYNEAGDSSKAIGILDDGLRYRPNATNLWLARAMIFQDDKRFDDARTGYLRVLQLTEPAAGHPVEAGTPLRFRAIAAHKLTVLDFSTGDFAEAELYARLALSLNFTGMNYHAALARSLREQGRMNEADAEDALEKRLRSEGR